MKNALTYSRVRIAYMFKLHRICILSNKYHFRQMTFIFLCRLSRVEMENDSMCGFVSRNWYILFEFVWLTQIKANDGVSNRIYPQFCIYLQIGTIGRMDKCIMNGWVKVKAFAFIFCPLKKKMSFNKYGFFCKRNCARRTSNVVRHQRGQSKNRQGDI